jgi:uncharacterized protein (DUF488 family)
MSTLGPLTPLTLYAVGHSNRPLEALLSLLRCADIRQLADVRANPSSQRFPQFNGEALREVLEEAQVAYHWAGRHLGGHRQGLSQSLHIALGDAGLRAYADHMETEVFGRAAGQLINLARRGPLAIMCAEKRPQNCHRSLIADYLTLQGHRVLHLIDENAIEEHQLDARARRESGRLVYDRLTTPELKFRQ